MDQHALAKAFGLCAGAGLSTTIGALFVFVPRFQNTAALAGSLAFAAGVMIYVSMVEIIVKSYEEFELHFDALDGVNRTNMTVDEYEGNSKAFHAAAGSFFGGLVLTALIDKFIHTLRENAGVADTHSHNIFADAPLSTDIGADAKAGASLLPVTVQTSTSAGDADDADPDATLLNVEGGGYEGGGLADMQLEFTPTKVKETSADDDASTVSGAAAISVAAAAASAAAKPGDEDEDDAEAAAPGDDGLASFATDDEEQKRLLTSAMLTGVAIVLHNIPEGLATFVAAAKDPAVGASLAIAIGVHNIPEGICVAVPIYFATGNKCKAFFWGTASGLAETLAGAAGWIALSQRDTDISSLAYAILFGIVGGMMVYISMNELLVTALRYDPQNKYTAFSAFAGMFVMAVSLSLFVG